MCKDSPGRYKVLLQIKSTFKDNLGNFNNTKLFMCGLKKSLRELKPRVPAW